MNHLRCWIALYENPKNEQRLDITFPIIVNYILASVFFRKRRSYRLFWNKTDDYLYLYIRNLENLYLKPFNLYLCWHLVDTKWILRCRKIGVKCAYLRFLIYKVIFKYDIKIQFILVSLLLVIDWLASLGDAA